ncbi:MAG: hypothetical protein QW727_02100 [Candidatus Pacearchaeota archaeon]
MKTMPFLSRRFISETHIFLCKKENGIYWPDYVGRSCMDSWIIENCKEVEMTINGIVGVINIDKARYVLELRYINFRHHEGKDWIEEGKKGHHLYFDEVLKIYFKRKRIFPEKLSKILRENRFREVD